LTAVGIDAFPATAEKMIAGVVTGIGFIGAGVVLRDPGGHVRGITTAAAVWAVATLGIAAGAGRFVLATLTATTFVLLLEMRSIPLLRRLDPRRWSHLFTDESEAAAASSPPEPSEPSGPT
jgi:putative Mg2+ transporter-C (MgtC) family protein